MTRTTIAPTISTRAFTYVKDESGFGGVFTIERSTLDHLGGLSRLYDDNSAAVGFVLHSAKSGLNATFALTSIETDRDGDVRCWILSPTFSSYNKPGCRHLQHVTVRVYNT
jgi:hypothetical protein